jgi:hypothetical protein
VNPLKPGPYLVGLVVAVLFATACGSGGGGSPARISIRALVRHTGCVTVARPQVIPYRGVIVFSPRNGHRLVARTDRGGRARLTAAPGRYRVAVAGQSTVRVIRARIDNRTLRIASDGRFPVTVGGGGTLTLNVVVVVGPTDCNSLGASGFAIAP